MKSLSVTAFSLLAFVIQSINAQTLATNGTFVLLPSIPPPSGPSKFFSFGGNLATIDGYNIFLNKTLSNCTIFYEVLPFVIQCHLSLNITNPTTGKNLFAAEIETGLTVQMNLGVLSASIPYQITAPFPMCGNGNNCGVTSSPLYENPSSWSMVKQTIPASPGHFSFALASCQLCLNTVLAAAYPGPGTVISTIDTATGSNICLGPTVTYDRTHGASVKLVLQFDFLNAGAATLPFIGSGLIGSAEKAAYDAGFSALLSKVGLQEYKYQFDVGATISNLLSQGLNGLEADAHQALGLVSSEGNFLLGSLNLVPTTTTSTTTTSAASTKVTVPQGASSISAADSGNSFSMTTFLQTNAVPLTATAVVIVICVVIATVFWPQLKNLVGSKRPGANSADSRV